jgi:hypothetical protein
LLRGRAKRSRSKENEKTAVTRTYENS